MSRKLSKYLVEYVKRLAFVEVVLFLSHISSDSVTSTTARCYISPFQFLLFQVRLLLRLQSDIYFKLWTVNNHTIIQNGPEWDSKEKFFICSHVGYINCIYLNACDHNSGNQLVTLPEISHMNSHVKISDVKSTCGIGTPHMWNFPMWNIFHRWNFPKENFTCKIYFTLWNMFYMWNFHMCI